MRTVNNGGIVIFSPLVAVEVLTTLRYMNLHLTLFCSLYRPRLISESETMQDKA